MKRLNIIIVAEGAIDINNKTITTEYIKDVSTESSCVSRRHLLPPPPRPPARPLFDLYHCTTAPLPQCAALTLTVTVFPGALSLFSGKTASHGVLLLFLARSEQTPLRSAPPAAPRLRLRSHGRHLPLKEKKKSSKCRVFVAVW